MVSRLTLAVAALLVVGGGVVIADTAFVDGEYERTTVTVTDEDGTTLATVSVRVADTVDERYVGLSDTESLQAGEGMLFVHPREGTYAYVMRDMDFPLDIVFADASGTVTRIHHAPVAPPGTSEEGLTRYRGTGKYVLEVPMGYTNETGIEVGDRLHVGSSDERPGGQSCQSETPSCAATD